MARSLIIGMNNPISDEPEHALYPLPEGCTGHRLWCMLRSETGATMRQYLSAFERTNLLIGLWDKRAARASASALLPSLAGRTVLLLGHSVRSAFDVPKSVLLDNRWDACARGKPGDFEPAMFYVLPHPSGRNPWYNDRDNCAAASRLLARLYLSSEAKAA